MGYETLSLACVLAPLVGFAVALVGFRTRHNVAAAIATVSGGISVAAAAMLLVQMPHAVVEARWFTIGQTPIEFGILLDGKTIIMGGVVALITFLIQLYSVWYMKTDPGKGRFFAFLAFFEWSMLAFVFASSLLQTFIFWELVGLASFLLIGFWYEKPSAVAAAKKAFLMTRIGDVGLFIGLILLFRATNTLDLTQILGIFAPEGAPASIAPDRVELIALLLFVGVIGKSAQFPLHTWLPDAMEGPTPVSALLHSATMVAAGVFLVARLHPLFLDAPATMNLIVAVATFTALLSSTMAMVARDMKRILAFSSISQLGFMLMGLGAGSLFAGFFHLTTHAFFKALLFMTAGSYIHCAHSNDIVAIGRAGAARKLPVTTFGLLAGGLALAGIPPLAGFFSKEQIIGAMGHYPLFKTGAYVAAFLTAYYTFRMIFLIMRPNVDSAIESEAPHAEEHHAPHETWFLRVPILVLSLLAIGTGFLGGRIGHALGIEHVHEASIGAMAPAIIIALTGVVLAWLDFGRRGARQVGFIASVPAIQKILENRWYIDAVYNATIVRLAVGVARACFTTETRGLDGAADGVAYGTSGAGRIIARSHAGRFQSYVALAGVIVAALTLYIALR